jgi:hypothetical protein
MVVTEVDSTAGERARIWRRRVRAERAKVA